MFPCSGLEEYKKIVSDCKMFKEKVLNNLCSAHQTGHKNSCTGEKTYSLAGYRSKNRKTIMKDNLQHDVEIRMGKCNICGENFSFLPSFLPRRTGGGKYEYGAQLFAMVGDAIQRGARGARAEVEAAFGRFGEVWQPLIDALRQILDGVRDVQVVEGLSYDNELDVHLLLEQLGG